MDAWKRIKHRFGFNKQQPQDLNGLRSKDDRFQSTEYPQKLFIPHHYFNEQPMLQYNIESIEEIIHMELIFNSCFMLLIATVNKGEHFKMMLFEKPNEQSKSLQSSFVLNLSARSIKKTFSLNGGNLVVILSSRYDDKLVLDRYDIQQEQLSIYHSETLILPGYRYSRTYSIVTASASEDGYLVFAITDISRHPQPLFIYVFECQSIFSKLLSFIDIRKISRGMVTSLCSLNNCSQLAIMTSCMEYILLDIQSGEMNVNELTTIVLEDDEEHVQLSKFHMESQNKDMVYAVTRSGIIHNVDYDNDQIRSVKSCFLGVSVVNIIYSCICPFNKFLYLINDESVYVYDTLNDRTICECSIGCVPVKGDSLITLNWFGDQLYVGVQDKIIALKLFSKICFSLRYLARFAILQHFSQCQIRNLNLGKKLEWYILHDN